MQFFINLSRRFLGERVNNRMNNGMKVTVAVYMLLRKLRSCAMELAALENTRTVLTCRSTKENMEG